MEQEKKKEIKRKNISILGSTGSIGGSTLDVVRKKRDLFRVMALAAGENIDLLNEQIIEFEPELVSVKDEACAIELKRLTGQNRDIEIVYGMEGLIQVAIHEDVNLVVSALVGSIGLIPTFKAIQEGKVIALANKEPLVMAGKMLMKEAMKRGVHVLHIYSEHNAIVQSLQGHRREDVRRIILTESGGPFLRYSREQILKVTPQEALAHPKWRMGKKVTVDSASLMNKGLEVIEAHCLFDIPGDRIDVAIHPQSIVHYLVEYVDGSMVALLGVPDMRIPVAYALSYPERICCEIPSLDLYKMGPLTFEKHDRDRFPALDLAYRAIEAGGTMPAVLNAANEIAVQAFLEGRLPFNKITEVVLKTMKGHHPMEVSSIDEILSVDGWARKRATSLIKGG